MKKIFYLCITLLSICAIFIISCNKEVSLENGITDIQAEGSLRDSTTDTCYASVVHGTFYNGVTPGSDTAYVTVQVNVTKAGTYNISSDAQNGIIFSDSGFFNVTGLQTIELKPIGTPILNVPTDFTYTFDSTTCGFTIDVQDSTGTGLGTKDSCYPYTVSGTFYNGVTPGTDTCFVTIQVNVPIAGNYNIKTSLTNGLMFSDSGTFTTSGLQNVVLKPTGTPLLNVSSFFSYTYNGITCGFSIDVIDSTGHTNGATDTVALQKWKFFNGSDGSYHTGNFTDSTVSFITIGSPNILTLEGYSGIGTDSIFRIQIQMPGPSITTGTFVTNSFTNFLYTTPTFGYLAGATSTGITTIQITDYDNITHKIKGSFIGTADDLSGNTITIEQGAFNTIVN